MTDSHEARVAVYLDFDNIVMSWYDRVHGRNSYSRDRQKIAADVDAPDIAARLAAATIDVGAIIDYAASFGTIVLTRAYADWSSPVNAHYRSQLVARAVDLVQLFPAAAYAKNGADIRLAVDTVEDMFRLPDLTHVVIAAGDSDYVPLAQRCKRLGRFVVGVGVAGSTAKSLAAACDQFDNYDTLPGITAPEKPSARTAASRAKKSPAPVDETADEPAPQAAAETTKDAAGSTTSTATASTRTHRRASTGKKAKADEADQEQAAVAEPPAAAPRSRRKKAATPPPAPVADDDEDDDESPEETEAAAEVLLERALKLEHVRTDDEWMHLSAVKSLIKRMDPSFSEKALGHRSFSDFIKAHPTVAEIDESTNIVTVRLQPSRS